MHITNRKKRLGRVLQREMKPNPNYTFLKQQVPDNRFTLLQGGTRCFVGETLVLTTTGYKQINNINIGDHVWSWHNDSLESKRVVNKFRYKAVHHKHKTIIFEGINFKIECTYDHKLLYDGEWTKANIIAERIMANYVLFCN